VTAPTAGGASWGEVRALFEELVELGDGERAARLARLADRELARQVADLLATEACTSILERVDVLAAPFLAELAGEDEAQEAAEAPPPERVGPYRLGSRLGGGGMGEVYLGEREDGRAGQRVAVKLLKRGMDSAQILKRFARERQILARLDHPHVARLYDGGLAEDGRPYFVMELVEGEPITDYCRRHALHVEARLRLVVDCCEAVESAHARQIVHRDLKPSNVMVTAEGAVKLLDFGIAKLLAEEEGEPALTHSGLWVMTPRYAAPEQVLGEPITTATDVFALGVLLYELLTGQAPHRREGRTPLELVHAIRHETPERPSTLVGKLDPRDLPLAQPSPRDVRRLRRRLRGDLDAIVLKALRREPARRHATAGELGEALRRHLSGHPPAVQGDGLLRRLLGLLRWRG
jgi:serine/threonine-protein kinase